MEQVTVIKVGGAVVEDPSQLTTLLDNFAAIPGKKILVHGGGRRATKVAAQLGIESHMVGGRRITDAEMLSVVTMVYGGLVNKNLVAQLQAKGVNALGLTGADMDVIRSHKRPLKKVRMDDGTDEMVDFGYVGDVDRADGKRLAQLLDSGIIPVVAPLTHDGNGNILNTNADTMASTVAKALASYYDVTLIFSFEKKGVLSNPDDDDSVIPVITHESYKQYVEDGTISGGMMPKIENALEAVDAGVKKVVITLAENINKEDCGTVIN
ncbi:MAG: acetylglutamate kinase [Prevotella sp.]|nr:acetylglutamate kinase [Prevotella sp.]